VRARIAHIAPFLRVLTRVRCPLCVCSKALPGALRHVAKHGGAEGARALRRLVAVWEERRVFGAGRTIKEFKDAVEEGAAAGGHAPAPGDAEAEEAAASRAAVAGVAAAAEALVAAQAAASAAAPPAGGADPAEALSAAEAHAAALGATSRAHARLSATLRAAVATHDRAASRAATAAAAAASVATALRAAFTSGGEAAPPLPPPDIEPPTLEADEDGGDAEAQYDPLAASYDPSDALLFGAATSPAHTPHLHSAGASPDTAAAQRGPFSQEPAAVAEYTPEAAAAVAPQQGTSDASSAAAAQAMMSALSALPAGEREALGAALAAAATAAAAAAAEAGRAPGPLVSAPSLGDWAQHRAPEGGEAEEPAAKRRRDGEDA
jgi:hypothetical protein